MKHLNVRTTKWRVNRGELASEKWKALEMLLVKNEESKVLRKKGRKKVCLQNKKIMQGYFES